MRKRRLSVQWEKKKKLASSGLFAIKELIFIYSLLNLLYEGKKNLNMIKSCYNKIRINYYTTFFMHNLLLDLSENRGKKDLNVVGFNDNSSDYKHQNTFRLQ